MRRSDGVWAANGAVAMKTDGTARVCQDWRGLNALPEPNSERLGNIDSIGDSRSGFTCFTPIDQPSRCTRLEIPEGDTHNTAFCDARGELWEFNRCGVGLTYPRSVIAVYYGGGARPSNIAGSNTGSTKLTPA